MIWSRLVCATFRWFMVRFLTQINLFMSGVGLAQSLGIKKRFGRPFGSRLRPIPSIEAKTTSVWSDQEFSLNLIEYQMIPQLKVLGFESWPKLDPTHKRIGMCQDLDPKQSDWGHKWVSIKSDSIVIYIFFKGLIVTFLKILYYFDIFQSTFC